jgi:predicted DNA-binding protein YlxM (UPF0122 family)
MSNLIKPSEYAKKMGISRQAVYAKIKKGILTSKSVDGKLYIVQNAQEARAKASETDNPSAKNVNPRSDTGAMRDVAEVLAAKDETISVLKETIADLKETNQMITSTLRSEVELLKEAFSEMKMLYSNQIERLKLAEVPLESDEPHDESIDEPMVSEEEIEVEAAPFPEIEAESPDEMGWIDLEDFFDEYGIDKKKKRAKILKRLKKLYKKGDMRIDRFNGELIVLAGADYSDVLTKKG